MLKLNNTTDKKIGPATADAKQVIEESKRQLHDTEMFFYFLRKMKRKCWFKKYKQAFESPVIHKVKQTFCYPNWTISKFLIFT